MAKKKHKLGDNLKGAIKIAEHQATHPVDTLKKAATEAGKDLKKAEEDFKKAAGTIGEVAAKAAHEAALVASFLPLHLFEPLEKAALKKKGVTLTGKEKAPQVAGLFLKHIIAGAPVSHFESMEHYKKYHKAHEWLKKGRHFEHMAYLEESDVDDEGNVDDGSDDIAQAVSDAIANAVANNSQGGGGSGGGSGDGGSGNSQPYNPNLNPYTNPAIIAAANTPSILAAATTNPSVPIKVSTGGFLPFTVKPHLGTLIPINPVVNNNSNNATGRRAQPTHRAIGRRHLEYFQLYDTLLNLKDRGVDITHLNTIKAVKSAAIKNGVYHFESLEHIDVADISKVGDLVQTGAGAIKAGNSQVEDGAFKAADLLAQNSGIPGASAVVDIIHKILDYIKGNQNKKKGLPLTADEAKLLGQKPADDELAASADQVQDQLVAIGVGNLKSTDVVKKPIHLNLFQRIGKAINPTAFAKKHPDLVEHFSFMHTERKEPLILNKNIPINKNYKVLQTISYNKLNGGYVGSLHKGDIILGIKKIDNTDSNKPYIEFIKNGNTYKTDKTMPYNFSSSFQES